MRFGSANGGPGTDGVGERSAGIVAVFSFRAAQTRNIAGRRAKNELIGDEKPRQARQRRSLAALRRLPGLREARRRP
jgi:hypothetical protein